MEAHSDCGSREGLVGRTPSLVVTTNVFIGRINNQALFCVSALRREFRYHVITECEREAARVTSDPHESS